MASYTVQQLKTFVASIPTAANTWLVEVPDDLVLPVVTNRSVDAKGGLWYTVRGYFEIGARKWTAVG